MNVHGASGLSERALVALRTSKLSKNCASRGLVGPKSKTSLDIYRRWKQKVKEEDVYDNTTASLVLFQAKTSTHPLNTRGLLKKALNVIHVREKMKI